MSMNKKISWRRVVSIILIVWAAINIAIHYSNNNPQSALWFCNTIIILMAIGLWLNNKAILSSAAISYLLFGIVWALDIVSWLITGSFFLNIIIYFASSTPLLKIVTSYHLLLLAISLWFIIKEKKIHRHAWIISSFHLLAISIITMYATNANVNCVHEICNLGKLSFIYSLRPSFVPLVIFNWVAFTVVGFIPVQIVLNLVKSRRVQYKERSLTHKTAP